MHFKYFHAGLRFAVLLTLLIAGAAFAQSARPAQLAIDTSLPSGNYASFALSADTASFSQDSAENKGLLEKGFGFPVSVRQVMDGHVLVLSASARALVPVPLGWRGFDDSRRTRLFTPGGKTGIVISAMTMDGAQGWDEAREQVWKSARQTAAERSKKDPRYNARLIRLADGTFGLRENNIYEADGDPYSSVILFRQHPDDPRTAIRMNLFSPIADFERHLALAALVIKDTRSVVPARGLESGLSKPAAPK